MKYRVWCYHCESRYSVDNESKFFTRHVCQVCEKSFVILYLPRYKYSELPKELDARLKFLKAWLCDLRTSGNRIMEWAREHQTSEEFSSELVDYIIETMEVTSDEIQEYMDEATEEQEEADAAAYRASGTGIGSFLDTVSNAFFFGRVNKQPLNECGKCGHTWYPKGSQQSARCPSCKSRLVRIA